MPTPAPSSVEHERRLPRAHVRDVGVHVNPQRGASPVDAGDPSTNGNRITADVIPHFDDRAIRRGELRHDA